MLSETKSMYVCMYVIKLYLKSFWPSGYS